jgi:hypothetical protein
MPLLNPYITASGAPAASAPTIKTATPTTGQTVAFDNASVDQTLYLTPAGTLLLLTVTLPSNGSSVIGQTVTIATTQTLTGLTVNGAASIINTVTTLLAGSVSFRKTAANTWVRV